MRSDNRAYRIMRVCVTFCVCAVGFISCASHQLSREVEIQAEKNNEAKKVVAQYVPNGRDRKVIYAALDDSTQILKKQDRMNTVLREKMSSMKTRVWFAAGIAIAAIVISIIVRKFR